MLRIQEILKHYNEIETSDPESELFQIKADIDRAINHAPLDKEERLLIATLYLSEPLPPVRGKPDKNGGQSGRPAGGLTQVQVAQLVVSKSKSNKAKELKTGRILKRATKKLSEFLGEGYD